MAHARQIWSGIFASVVLSACAPTTSLQRLQAVGSNISQSIAPSRIEPLTDAEIALRKRQYRNDSEVVFSAAMSVAQDAGFRLQSADRSTGLITAIGISSRQLKLGLTGFGEAIKSPILSIHVEAVAEGQSEIRIGLVEGSGTNAGQSGEKPIRDREVYERLFTSFETELARRSAMLNASGNALTVNEAQVQAETSVGAKRYPEEVEEAK